MKTIIRFGKLLLLCVVLAPMVVLEVARGVRQLWREMPVS